MWSSVVGEMDIHIWFRDCFADTNRKDDVYNIIFSFSIAFDLSNLQPLLQGHCKHNDAHTGIAENCTGRKQKQFVVKSEKPPELNSKCGKLSTTPGIRCDQNQTTLQRPWLPVPGQKQKVRVNETFRKRCCTNPVSDIKCSYSDFRCTSVYIQWGVRIPTLQSHHKLLVKRCTQQAVDGFIVIRIEPELCCLSAVRNIANLIMAVAVVWATR